MRLKDKVAIITGGAHGMGEAEARLFAKEGAAVVIADMLADEGEGVAAEINAIQGRARFVRTDVTSEADWQALIAETITTYGRLDILVNNAGILRDKLIGMISDAEIEELFDVNVIGLIKITQLAARLMARRKSGSIINISSIVGRRGNSGQTVYSATKSAVIGATFSAAKELAPMNIRVNAVAPGLIQTSMINSIPEDKRKSLESNIAMGRVGSPHDVANTILFLASDLSSYVTGQVIGVDGGLIV